MGGQNIFDDSWTAKNIRAHGTGPGRIAALTGPTGLQKPKNAKSVPISAEGHLAGGLRCSTLTEKVESRFRFECMLVRTPSTESKT